MSPVKGSDLERQIEMARRELESWPQWLKNASGIGDKKAVVASDGNAPATRLAPSLSDFLDD
ncbi:hypothetical protein ACFPN2_13745 [Steroidobacter flavus]|uniref:Uncharacterized protein n=1 Tax=Steroidobacter flavus TaxID=1842136 RepID=A0ABV8SUE4_9GAMM